MSNATTPTEAPKGTKQIKFEGQMREAGELMGDLATLIMAMGQDTPITYSHIASMAKVLSDLRDVKEFLK